MNNLKGGNVGQNNYSFFFTLFFFKKNSGWVSGLTDRYPGTLPIRVPADTRVPWKITSVYKDNVFGGEAGFAGYVEMVFPTTYAVSLYTNCCVYL